MCDTLYSELMLPNQFSGLVAYHMQEVKVRGSRFSQRKGFIFQVAGQGNQRQIPDQSPRTKSQDKFYKIRLRGDYMYL